MKNLINFRGIFSPGKKQILIKLRSYSLIKLLIKKKTNWYFNKIIASRVPKQIIYSPHTNISNAISDYFFIIDLISQKQSVLAIWFIYFDLQGFIFRW